MPIFGNPLTLLLFKHFYALVNLMWICSFVFKFQASKPTIIFHFSFDQFTFPSKKSFLKTSISKRLIHPIKHHCIADIFLYDQYQHQILLPKDGELPDCLPKVVRKEEALLANLNHLLLCFNSMNVQIECHSWHFPYLHLSLKLSIRLQVASNHPLKINLL